MTRQLLTQLIICFGGFEEAWAKHCLNVACLSRKIAKNIENVNKELAFLYGLVHDIGRSTPRSHKDPRYHCVDGYLILDSLQKKAEIEFSKKDSLLFSKLKMSPLTHSFPDLNNLSLVPGYYNPLWDPEVKNKDDIKISGIWDTFIPQNLRGYKSDLYDAIVCLSDLMSASNKTVTIEERLEMVSEKYGKSPKEDEIKNAINISVENIERLAEKNLYEMVGIK